MSKDAPGWYRGFLTSVVLPHAEAFGYAIEITELLAGAVLIGLALVLLVRPQLELPLPAIVAGVVASAAALVMVVDFELANGGGFGLSLGKDAFDEGFDLDTLMTGVQLALLLFWSRSPAAAPRSGAELELAQDVVERACGRDSRPATRRSAASASRSPGRKLSLGARRARRRRAPARIPGARPAPGPVTSMIGTEAVITTPAPRIAPLADDAALRDDAPRAEERPVLDDHRPRVDAARGRRRSRRRRRGGRRHRSARMSRRSPTCRPSCSARPTRRCSRSSA